MTYRRLHGTPAGSVGPLCRCRWAFLFRRAGSPRRPAMSAAAASPSNSVVTWEQA